MALSLRQAFSARSEFFLKYGWEKITAVRNLRRAGVLTKRFWAVIIETRGKFYERL